ncbi:MAG: ribosome silencing factor [Fibrobacteres bacterium]|jgi:ribosome-associated protein|nr:ribosome silencing factor [Fibrobacterota bacterium]
MAKSKTVVEAQALAGKAAALLFAKKADELVMLDLRGLSSLTDFYLICTCQNEAQMRVAMHNTSKALSKEGIKPLRSEYHSGVRWAVLDYGDLIIHLFEKDTRSYYSLERLWADAKATKLKAEDYITQDEKAAEDEDEDL